MSLLKLVFEYRTKDKPILTKVKPYGRGSGRITFDGIGNLVGEEVVIAVIQKTKTERVVGK